MTLKEWMEAESIGVPHVATELECSAETVRRYVHGHRIPGQATMLKIVALTAGRVTANDFYGIAQSSQVAA